MSETYRAENGYVGPYAGQRSGARCGAHVRLVKMAHIIFLFEIRPRCNDVSGIVRVL